MPFKLFTPHDGLAQSQVQCIFQDSRGYIWLGTHGGVSFYNGDKFQNLTTFEGLPATTIKQIQEDAKGNIWMCAGKCFCKYDGKKLTCDTANVRPSDGRFFIDKNNTAWCINSKDDFLYKSEDFKTWDCVSKTNKSLEDKKFCRLNYDKFSDRFFLMDKTNHSYVYQDNNLKQLSIQNIGIPNHFENREMIYSGCRDSIFSISKENKISFVKKVNSMEINDIFQTENSKLFFTNHDSTKLYSINKQNHSDSLDVGATTNLLFEDRDKNLWIGCEEGLVRLFLKGFKNFSKKELSGVWSMAEDAKGIMWFGGYFDHKLHTFDGNKITEKKIDYKITSNQIKGNFGGFYFGGDRDSKGNLYFPMSWGIMKYDGNKFSPLYPMKKDTNISLFFSLDKVRNKIVSGSTKGVNDINLNTNEVKYYGKSKGLVTDNMFVLGVSEPDSAGNYWLATGDGISYLDLKTDSITKNYHQKLKNLAFNGVITIYSDYRGTVWAGSSKGLLRYNAKADTFELFANHIIHNKVSAINAVKDKYLVVGAKDGVYFLDLNAYYHNNKTNVHAYNQHNGYEGIEPNQNCFYVDSKENVWVSASDIVTKITPSELDFTVHPLNLFITEINNERIPYSNYNSTLSLPHGINTAKIRFEAVGFERPFKTEYRYRLDNETWTNWLEEDFAIEDNLSSGTHTFYVQTRPSGTVDEAGIKERHLQFNVSVPFWRDTYFPVLVSFFIVGLGFLARFFVNKEKTQKEKEKLEYDAYFLKQEALNKENEKFKHEQEELNSERERQIKYLEIQTLLSQLNPHFIFGVLSAIQNKIMVEDREKASSLIVDLSNLIRRFLESTINSNFNKLRSSEVTLAEEIKLLKSYIEFEQLQYSDNFDFKIKVAEDINIENIQVPPMMIQPYVENAIKHGILYEKEKRCTLVLSFMKTDDNVLVCTITDNGVGRARSKEIQDAYLKMYKSRSTDILNDRIKIMQELGHGIYVETMDNPEGGTIVELKIDL